MLRHSGLGWVPLESGVVAMTSSRLSIRIVLANGRKLGPAKIALLEAIAAHGSISGAARSLGISYRGAWISLASINSVLRDPAVATKIGGHRRGGAALTPIGERVLALYRAIQNRAQSAAANELHLLGTMARARALLGGPRNRHLTDDEHDVWRAHSVALMSH
jgi:molybdate transport system regulatory protein